MKEYKVKMDVRPIKQGREVKVAVTRDDHESAYFRICPAGEVRQTVLDLINIAFDDALEV